MYFIATAIVFLSGKPLPLTAEGVGVVQHGGEDSRETLLWPFSSLKEKMGKDFFVVTG